MKTRFHTLRKSAATRIVGGLLLANLIAYMATSSYVHSRFDRYSSNSEHQEVPLIETGWQVMHWSYSLLEFFRHTNPGENM